MGKIDTDKTKIDRFLNSRYIEAVLPSKDKAVEMMSSGRRLVFYWGIDPTGPDVHLGHTTNAFVMKGLAKLGHKIILLIGDFTATIGDPTDKEATRKPMNDKEVRKNMETYLDQMHKILPKGTFEVRHNSKWYRKMDVKEWLGISALFTQQQMVVRDMFQERIKKDKPISMQEFIYPILQGYDSVAMDVDGEVGGNDQLFNMMAGRDLLHKLKNKDKLVITTRLLEDQATGRKIMNKSEGQYISLNDSSDDMFGKIMATPDSAILPLLKYATEISDREIDQFEKRLGGGENPKTLKEELAYELVRMYHGEKAAEKTKMNFASVFSEGKLPEEMPEFQATGGSMDIVSVLKEWLGISMSEAKRLVDQGAVRVNDEVVNAWDYQAKPGDVIKCGPRKFVRIK